MKILIETAEELFRFAEQTRDVDDATPFLGDSAKLVITNVIISGVDKALVLEGAGDFTLSPDLTLVEVITEALQRQNIGVCIE